MDKFNRTIKTIVAVGNSTSEALDCSGSLRRAAGRRKLNCRQTLIVWCLFIINPCFALPDDSKEMLQFTANTADLSQEAHRGIYTGEVAVDQGTTHIRADKAITIGDDKNHLSKAILTGNTEAQAHYWVLMEKDKPVVHAYADTIHYYPEKHLIKLIGHAKVKQGSNSFSAPLICYDTLHQHVTSQSKDNERTTIVFYPEKHT